MSESITNPNFTRLCEVFDMAYEQAANGKGIERHGFDMAFEHQPMQDIARLHGLGFLTGQADKKSREALHMVDAERQIHELLGAINYLAGAIIYIQDNA